MGLSSELKDFLGNKLILVVEPSTNYRTLLKQYIGNFEIKNSVFVSSVAEAKKEMVARKIGLVICEWNLPEVNGLMFCRELRKDKNHQNVPFVLLSVENMRKDVVLASEVGIYRYLLKPFSFEDFYSYIETTLNETLHPDTGNVVISKAELLLKDKNYADAEVVLTELLKKKPNSARARCGLAQIKFNEKKFDEAQSLLEESIQINPDYLEAYRILLQIHEEKKSLPGIIKTALVLHSLSPDNPRYPLLIARNYLDFQKLEESERFFKIAARLSPTLAEAYRGLGSIYLQTKQYDKAEKNFAKSLDLDKNDVATLNGMGMTLVRIGKIDEGIKRYQAALRLDAFDSKVLFNLGLAYEISDMLSQAIISYKKALSVDPEFHKAKRGIQRIEMGKPLTKNEDSEK